MEIQKCKFFPKDSGVSSRRSSQEEAAAIKIQATLRGHLVRRSLGSLASLPKSRDFPVLKTRSKSVPSCKRPTASGSKFWENAIEMMPTGSSDPADAAPTVNLANTDPSTAAPPTQAPPNQNPPTQSPPTQTPPEEEVDIDLKDPEVEKAALLIQKKTMFGKKKPTKPPGSGKDSPETSSPAAEKNDPK